jgi:hypothetical protein
MSGDADNMPKVSDWPKEPDPDHAWKALSLVNDWIRHADAKIGVTLAATGVAGATLFNLMKDAADPSCWLKATAALCAAALLWTAACAVIGLVPQVKIGKRRDPESYTNLLFYRHIAGGWEGKPAAFVFALGSLIIDKQELTKHIGEQVHANASVARRKYVWADRAIRGLAVGLLLLAITATLRVLG